MHVRLARIAIVGHRALGGAPTDAFVASASRDLLLGALRSRRDVSAVSALAEGADTLFAEAALALGLPLHVVTPFADYEDDFVSPAARNRFVRLRAAAMSEQQLPYVSRSDRAYQAAMRWVVGTSDVLLAAWDGRPSLGPGGTGHAVAHALSLGREVVHLDVVDHVVRPCVARP